MKNKINVGFLVKSTNGTTTSWDCFLSLYKDLSLDGRFECSVFICPDLDWNNLAQEASTASTEKCVTNSRVPYFLLTDKTERIKVLAGSNLDYIFITSNSPSFAEYSPGISFNKLRRLAKICYVPYGAVTVTDDPYNDGNSWHAKAPNHLNSSIIFADALPLAKILIDNGYSPAAIKQLGHIKIAGLLKLYSDMEKEKTDNAFELTVLVGQHHSMKPSWISSWNFGTFDVNHSMLIQLVRKNPTIRFIFSPHPLLAHAFDEIFGVDAFADWLETFEAEPNTVYSTSTSTAELFSCSDLLITDGISYLTEYPIVANKPVIYIENPLHLPMNALGNLGIDGAIKVTEFAQIQKHLDHFKSDNNRTLFKISNQSNREKLLSAFLPNLDRTNSLVANVLVEKINEPSNDFFQHQLNDLTALIDSLQNEATSIDVVFDASLQSALFLYLLISKVSNGQIEVLITVYTEETIFKTDRLLDYLKEQFGKNSFITKQTPRQIEHKGSKNIICNFSKSATLGPNSVFPTKHLNELYAAQIIFDLELRDLFEASLSCEQRLTCYVCKTCEKRASLLGKLMISPDKTS